VDGQDFADIEAYGVERWLAELALALRPNFHGFEENGC
jgi:RNA-directed DNA polymerase